MEIAQVKIEQQLEKRLRDLLEEKMDEIVHQVVKRAVPEISYRLIQDGYQADQAAGPIGPSPRDRNWNFPSLDYFGLPGPPGRKILKFVTGLYKNFLFRSKRRSRSTRVRWASRSPR